MLNILCNLRKCRASRRTTILACHDRKEREPIVPYGGRAKKSGLHFAWPRVGVSIPNAIFESDTLSKLGIRRENVHQKIRDKKHIIMLNTKMVADEFEGESI